MSNNTWAELFPDGRTIFYEGDDPEAFRKLVKTEFGFDPSEHPGDLTGLYNRLDAPRESTWDEQHGWSFHCPAEHLNAIYSNSRFPMGS